MMENVIYSISTLNLVISSIVLVSSIVGKDKRYSALNIITGGIYLAYSVMVFPFVISHFDIDIGWDSLIIDFKALAGCVMLIAGMIISAVKIHKQNSYQQRQKNDSSILHRTICLAAIYIVCLLVPLFIFVCTAFHEKNLLSSANLILVYNYQNGIVISEDTIIAVSDGQCSAVSDSNLYENTPGTRLKVVSYDVNVEDDELIVSSYDDKDLLDVDIEKIKQIASDSLRHTTSADEDERGDRKEINVWTLGDSEYYVVDVVKWPMDRTKAGTGIGEFVYKGTSYNCTLHSVGNLKQAILLKR